MLDDHIQPGQNVAAGGEIAAYNPTAAAFSNKILS